MVELVEHPKSVQPRSRAGIEGRDVEARLLARRDAEGHDDAPLGYPRQRGRERGAAHGLQDHVVERTIGVDAHHHPVRTQLGQTLRPLGARRHRGHVGTGIVCQLYGEAPHPAGCPGHQHAAAEQRCGHVEHPHGGEAGHGQSRGVLEAHALRQLRQAARGNGGQLGPGALVHESAHARALGRPAAVSRGIAHHARHVPAVHGALLAVGQVARLAAVERDGAHLHQRFVRRRCRRLDLPQLDSLREPTAGPPVLASWPSR